MSGQSRDKAQRRLLRLDRDLQQALVHQRGVGTSIQAASDPFDGTVVLQGRQASAGQAALLGLRRGEGGREIVDRRLRYGSRLLTVRNPTQIGPVWIGLRAFGGGQLGTPSRSTDHNPVVRPGGPCHSHAISNGG